MINIDEQYYREELLDHYQHPRNKKELKDANAVASQNNPMCGDSLIIMLKIEDGVVKDAGFKGSGCAISIAFASKMTEDIKNKKIDEILKLDTKCALSLFPGELAAARYKCALLAFSTIKDAIKKHEKVE